MKKIKFLLKIIMVSFVVIFPSYFFTEAAEEPFSAGDGSSGSPYQIQNCEQLQYINHYDEEMSSYPYLSENYYFVLKNDIDCSDTLNWNSGEGFIPIGTGGYSFTGTFLGDKHTISDLYINISDDNAGLFGRIDNSHIDNLGLENINIQGLGYVGGLTGYSYDSHLENIYTTGVVSGTDNYIGGLVGFLVGEFGYFPDTVVNSYSTCDVSGNESVGGLIGLNNSDMIYNSFATGDIEGNTNNSGGLIGSLIFNIENGDTINDFIFNSGWSIKIGFNGIGSINNEASMGDELSYNENDETLFYSKSHGVFAQEMENSWDFEATWAETENDYPKFISIREEPVEEPLENTNRRSRSSGSTWIFRYNNLLSMGKIYEAEELLRQFGNQVIPNLINQIVDTNNKPLDTNLSNIRTLRYGMVGDDVKKLQDYLNVHGYECGLGDGKFGSKTKQAVIKFQITNGLFGDGVVGPLTRDKLK